MLVRARAAPSPRLWPSPSSSPRLLVPEEHLLHQLELAGEERADRLTIVDAPDGLADERRHRQHLDLRERLAGGSGIVSVTTTSVSAELRIRSMAGSDSTPCVAQA